MSVLVRASKKERLFGKHSTPSFLKQPKKEKKISNFKFKEC